MKKTTVMISLLLATLTAVRAADDLVVNDFESETFGDWKVEGTAFSPASVTGPISGQEMVTGYKGNRFVNSFHGGGVGTGKLTSPEFKIERKYINFLIGGGKLDEPLNIRLLVAGKAVRIASGSGGNALTPLGWDVTDLIGANAVIQVVDNNQARNGYVLLDQIVQSDSKPETLMVKLDKTLTVNGTHLILPVGNGGRQNEISLRIFDGNQSVQAFSVSLPKGNDPFWLAAYPLDSFGVQGKQIRIDGGDALESALPAFEKIKIGSESEVLSPSDYTQPYRNQFHASTRRGWVNDPNGLVYKDGKYHLYYQFNPFGTHWGNMHWGHLKSTDLVHWEQKPIAIFMKSGDRAHSGSGLVDVNDTAGYGKGTQFAIFTSTGRGQCLVYSKDGGLSFKDIDKMPVLKNPGRDPKVIWYEPEKKWVMAVYEESKCAEVLAVPRAKHDAPHTDLANIAFYESKDLKQWTRTGAFTDPQRFLLMECPDMFELPVPGKPGESRWFITGAANCYFLGKFDGKTFHKESGPHGKYTGTFYAGQVFSDAPNNRRIQMGWVRSAPDPKKYPDAIFSQAFSIPNEVTLRETSEGIRACFLPVKEFEQLRGEVLAEGKDLTPAQVNEILQKCKGLLTETYIEFTEDGKKDLWINGINASFTGRKARIFTDRTINDIYADDGLSFEIRFRSIKEQELTLNRLAATEGTLVKSLKIYRLKSIWTENVNAKKMQTDICNNPKEIK